MKRNVPTLLATLLGVASFAQAQPLLLQKITPQPLVLQLPEGKISFANLLDVPEDQVLDVVKFMNSGGYWIQSVYAYGPKNQEKFGFVMVKQDGVKMPQQLVQLRSNASANGTLNSTSNFEPFLVAATPFVVGHTKARQKLGGRRLVPQIWL